MLKFLFVCDVCSTFWHQHPLSHLCYGTTERRIRVVQMVSEPKEEKDMAIVVTENVSKEKILEVALKWKKAANWCDEDFKKALAELGISWDSTPPDPLAGHTKGVIKIGNSWYLKDTAFANAWRRVTFYSSNAQSFSNWPAVWENIQAQHSSQTYEDVKKNVRWAG